MTAQFGMSLYLPSFLMIKKVLILSSPAIQKTLSFFVLGYASLMLLWGSFAEYFGRKKTLIAIIIFFIISSLLITATRNIILFYILRIVQGAASGGLAVTSRILIRDHFKGKMLTKNMIILSIAFATAFPLSQISGAFINMFYSWRVDFWFLALLGILALILTILWDFEEREKIAKKSKERKKYFQVLSEYNRILSNKNFLSIVTVGSIGYIISVLYQTVSPIYLMETLKLSVKEYSITSILNTISYLLGILTLHQVIDRYPSKILIRISVISLFFLGFLLFFSAFSSSSLYFVSLMASITFCTAALYPLNLTLALESFPLSGPQATAAFGFLQQVLASIFSFLVAGAIHNVFMLAIMLILFGYIGLKLSNKMIHSSEII